MSTSRINPDSRPVLIAAIVTTALLALVSFLLSYSGLVAVAEWAAVPAWLAWAVPVTIDGAILVYTLAALVFRARGETARVAWLSLSLFTGLSVTANAAHAWDAGTGDGRALLGALIAGLAPVAVLLTTHTIARLVIAPPSAEPDVEAVPSPSLVDWAELIPSAAEPVPRPERRSPRPAAAKRPALSPEETEARNARILALGADPDRSVRDIAAEVGTSKSTVSRVLGRPQLVDA